jgi:heme/copper-type cytochrome/quinol oxidase subunit 2
MQQQPLDYESPPRESPHALRRTMGRLASGAWLLFGVASALLWFNASDQNSLQWPAAIFMAISMFLAAVLTVVYWGVVVVVWFRKRANANR